MTGVALKLKGVTFNNPALPMLGDFGKLSELELDGLFKLTTDATKLKNEYGADMVLAGGATAPNLPSFADGILTMPNAGGAGQISYYNSAVPLAGADSTIMMLVKPLNIGTRDQYLMTGSAGGVNLLIANPGTLSAVYNNGTTRFANIAGGLSNSWVLVELTTTATHVKGSVNGGARYSASFASLPGAAAPTFTADRLVRLGNAGSAAQGIWADLALVGIYNRALSDSEVISAYRGIRAFAASKGIEL